LTEPIELSAYDPTWPAAFERERALIAPILGTNAVQIEHMGSTSIPGLPAKPIIDVIVLVDDLAAARARSRPSRQPAIRSGQKIPTRPSCSWSKACHRRRAVRITCIFTRMPTKWHAT
jgi:GrpB-like predicted nucleotidyltransferase (UPF0157 family)